MGKIVPIALVLTGLLSGGAAGHFMRPAAIPVKEACAPQDLHCDAQESENISRGRALDVESDFANLAKQFVVPIVNDDRVEALVVASLSLEVEPGFSETVYTMEPKLRNEFLKVLFTHAHSGGFNGEFTSSNAMNDLRTRLYQVAHDVLGDPMLDVLIVEIVRQDM